MTKDFDCRLPDAWAVASISEIAEINPVLDKSAIDDDLMVSFVPMAAVEAETGVVDVSTARRFGEVKKGYTSFRENDILFAKITPCMENGKIAVAPVLQNDFGFGSTEFHVLRPKKEIAPKYLYHFVASKRFRSDAERNMTGAVGQRRVPSAYLSNRMMPIPPVMEQQRIVAKIEELFSELEKGIESLKTAREQLKLYRQAILKHAFEGKLTARWREENKDKLETPEQIFERIKREREAYYQRQFADWEAGMESWEKNLNKGKKPEKPVQDKTLPPIGKDEISVLPKMPLEWGWFRLASIAKIGSGMSVSKDRPIEYPVDVPYLRVANVQRGTLVLDEIKTMLVEKSSLQELCLEKWDVLFNEGGDRDKLGRGWIWEEQISPCITQNHVFRASPYVKERFHSKFISHWGNTFGRNYFDKGGKQTTNLASINKKVLSMFPVPMPSLAEQQTIVDMLDDSMSIIDAFERDIEHGLVKSETLRQSILKKAFSGQLVPQDPDDEPATALLERIRAEKAAQAETNKPKVKRQPRRKRAEPV